MVLKKPASAGFLLPSKKRPADSGASWTDRGTHSVTSHSVHTSTRLRPSSLQRYSALSARLIALFSLIAIYPPLRKHSFQQYHAPHDLQSGRTSPAPAHSVATRSPAQAPPLPAHRAHPWQYLFARTRLRESRPPAKCGFAHWR